MSKKVRPKKRQTLTASQALMIARAEAIEQYADLENVLCIFFGWLMKAEPNLASITFFRITSARARNSIIEKLMAEVVKENDFKPYWKSLFKMIGEVDGSRNAIVHWQTKWEIRFDDDGKVERRVLGLAPRKLGLGQASSDEWIDVPRLKAFTGKIYFITTSIVTFLTIFGATGRPDSIPERDAWLRIFRHKAIYPPPETHPIFQRPGARENLHPPYEEIPILPGDIWF